MHAQLAGEPFARLVAVGPFTSPGTMHWDSRAGPEPIHGAEPVPVPTISTPWTSGSISPREGEHTSGPCAVLYPARGYHFSASAVDDLLAGSRAPGCVYSQGSIQLALAADGPVEQRPA